MAGLIGVAGAKRANELLEAAAVPVLRRPWETLAAAYDHAAGVGLGFAGERGGVYLDRATGVRAVLDGELFREDAILSGSEGAQRLAELYVRDGEAFDPGDGWFGAAIWDPRSQALLLVADLIGHRPLYVARLNGVILAAGQLKSLVAAGLEPSLDLQAWAEIFAYESPLGERTPLEGVRLVQPATTLVLGLTGGERSHERWRYRIEPETHADEGELVAEFGRVLEQAVIRRTDAKTALALSGGLDSRCVATILRRRSPSTVACTYGAVSSEDLVLGTQVAAETGLPHLAFPLEPGYIARWAAETVWSSEGQVRCFHAHHVALRELRRSQGVHSLLIGFAGDAVVRDAPLATAAADEAGFADAFTRPGPPLLPTDSQRGSTARLCRRPSGSCTPFTRTTPCRGRRRPARPRVAVLVQADVAPQDTPGLAVVRRRSRPA